MLRPALVRHQSGEGFGNGMVYIVSSLKTLVEGGRTAVAAG